MHRNFKGKRRQFTDAVVFIKCWDSCITQRKICISL
jgi:hypothetical protein